MAALFTPRADRWLRAALVAAFLLILGTPTLLMAWVRTPQVTGQHRPVEQPVLFDHRHHTLDAGLDCLYCHDGAERSRRAGVPPTSVCMGCHGQIWGRSEQLEPVRRSWTSGQPIRWNRVHRLPDFVFFDHSVHVKAGGLACAECHGDVTRMAQVEQVAPLTMGWCLDCHRERRGGRHTRQDGRRALPGVHCTACHR